MDIWTAPVGATVEFADARLTVVDRHNDRDTVSLRLRGSSPDGEVRADLRRSPVRPAIDAYLCRPLTIGERLAATFEVGPAMLTHHIPHGPAVLMTPNLVGLMEETAAQLVRPTLAPGAAAVGTFIGIRHTGAATLGERVTVCAEITERTGRQIDFAVEATVDGRRIGHGQIGFTFVAAPPGN